MTRLFSCLLILFVAQVHADDILRIGSWNVSNRPNDLADDANFAMVLTGIGDQVVNGNASRLCILAVQETDTQSSIDLRDILNASYGVSSYEVITSTPDGGNDRTAIVYDTGVVSLLATTELTAGLTHHTVRATFMPVNGSEPLTIYTVHLASGASSADALDRGIEANILRFDADLLGEGTNVLFVGDFNMLGSSEAAWANLVAAGNAEAFDVADAPGEWRDNPAFLSLHTQATESMVDDRFDIHFATDELFDGVGIDYADNSYTVFGNNGTHMLNGSIASGFGASQAELAALIAASDHLPVFSDYVLIALLGDFDLDGDVDTDDIDFYSGNLGQPASLNAELDLNGDGTITLADHDSHVTTLVQTLNGETGSLIGDINLDGTVDVFADGFVLVGNLGNSGPLGYADGDLNADGVVNVLGDAFRLVRNLGLSKAQ